jgi:hypothetical protein
MLTEITKYSKAAETFWSTQTEDSHIENDRKYLASSVRISSEVTKIFSL